MLTAIDIGNTYIKAGVFHNDELKEVNIVSNINSIPSTYLSSENDFAICSVVPEKTKIISDFIKQISNKIPFILSKNIKFNLKISYKTPDTLGLDRLASAEGAFFLYKNSVDFVAYNNKTFLITIDFGTATTINVIKYPGTFAGGIIAPGLNMMFNALQSGTAQLPNVSAEDYDNIIGDSTKSSIASGVLNSITGLIEKTIRYIKTDNETETIIYITGGNAKKIMSLLNFDFIFEEGLVLYGINALYKINN